MAADSRIDIKTRIDDSGITSGLKKVKKELDEAQKSYERAEKEYAKAKKALSENPFNKGLLKNAELLEKRLDASGAPLEDLRDQYENLANVEPIGKNIDTTTKKLNSLLDKREELEALGVDKESAQWKRLSYQIDIAREKLIKYYDELETKMPGSTTDLRPALDNLAPATEKARDLKSSLSGIVKNANAFVSTGIHRFLGIFSKKADESNSAAKKLGRGIFSLGNMFKLLVLRMLMRAAIKAMQEGFKNLAAYSAEANASMAQLQNSGTYLANSLATAFQPLLHVVANVFSQIVDWIAAAINALNRFFAILGGKSTYTVAIKQNKKYGESAKGAAKATKEQERALASFDEINQLHLEKSSDSGGGGGSGSNPNEMFKTVSTGAASDFELKTAEKLKAIWADLEQAAKNLGDAWQEAWNHNENGVRITETLKGMWFDLLDNIKQITEATERWSASLDLIPLMTAIADILESIRPILNDIEMVGVWIYENIVLPLLSYIIEDAGPRILELFSSINNLIDTLWHSVLEPLWDFLWETFIKPLADFLGEKTLDGLDGLKEGIDGMTQFIEEHGEAIQTVLIIIGSVIAALVIVMGVLNAVHSISMLVNGVITGMATAFSFLTSPIGLVVLAIGAVIAIIVLCIKHWDEIKEAAGKAADWIGQKWADFKNAIGNYLGGVKDRFNRLLSWINGTFLAGWELAWGVAKDVFKNIWNTIADICESVVNGIIKALNAISFDVPDWVPGIGGKHLGFNLQTISIPRLATGTVVPPHAGEFAAILGDNKTDTEVVSPLETMKEAMIEAMQQSGNAGGRQVVIRFEGNLAQLARILKPYIKNEDKRSGVNLVLDAG